MARRGREDRWAAFTADEFASRFQASAGALWTVAAGILGDRSEADDVLQDAAVMALAKLDRFEPGTNFLAWMGSFVRNVALNRRRKRVRRQTASVDDELLDGRAPAQAFELPPENGAAAGPIDRRGELHGDQRDFDDRVLAALAELGPIPRACLLLRAVTELAYRDIAGVLAIPEGTAMSHVHRSRMQLRESLGEGARPRGLARPESRA